MLFEGTEKYFWLLFFIYFIIYIIVKICLSKIFKKAGEKGYKAYIPIYNKLVLVNIFDLKKSVFYKTLIPFANLYYYYVIISRMLEVFNMDKKDAILFLIVPMYKFPELVFKNPNYTLHMYEETEKFFSNEKTLFEKEEKPVEEINNNLQTMYSVGQNQNTNNSQILPNQNNITSNMQPQNTADKIIINPSGYNQQIQTINNDSVFTNSSLEPDERKETIIEAKKEEIKQDKNPILTEKGRPKVCPKCGTKLESDAKVCFFCGTQIS